MRNLLFLLILASLFACKNKKKLSGNEHIEAEEFFSAYENIKLPFSVSDTNFKKVLDTNTISYAIFTQFIPDSIFNAPFKKDRKLIIHPIGKFQQKGKETYFTTVVTTKSDTAVYLSVYDKNKFIATLPLASSNNDEAIITATVDKKLSIVINKEWTIKNDIFYNRIIYAYNNVGLFTTVLTETNEDRRAEKTLSNPIDTFAARNKYSGDYYKGNRNIVSLRDGKEPNQYLFFLYFENGSEDQPCGGELRGVMNMISEKEAVFQGDGDPCKLNFIITANTIKVIETGSCGNYRGIRCFFNDTYTKRKVIKAAAKKK